jgi:hypothetical protein
VLGAHQPQLPVRHIARDGAARATIASAPIFTGAISELFEPMNAPSPISVCI